MAAIAPVSADQYYQGEAYSIGNHQLLYRESHWLYLEQGRSRRLVLYQCPDGAAFARKTSVGSSADTAPDFEFIDGRVGYREGVRSGSGQRLVFARDNSSEIEREAPLSEPPGAIIDAGFDDFIRSHWDTLSTEGVSAAPFLVPSRLRFFNFGVHRLRDETEGSDTVRWFRLSMSSWFNFVLPHIDVAYALTSHELRHYRGLSNIRGPGNSNLDVDIDFPASERRAFVTPAELLQAANAPLTGRCDRL